MACARGASLTWHAKRVRSITLSSVASLASPKFFDTILGKKVIERKMCGLILSKLLSETLLILRRVQRDIIINLKTPSCQVSVILV